MESGSVGQIKSADRVVNASLGIMVRDSVFHVDSWDVVSRLARRQQDVYKTKRTHRQIKQCVTAISPHLFHNMMHCVGKSRPVLRPTQPKHGLTSRHVSTKHFVGQGRGQGGREQTKRRLRKGVQPQQHVVVEDGMLYVRDMTMSLRPGRSLGAVASWSWTRRR